MGTTRKPKSPPPQTTDTPPPQPTGGNKPTRKTKPNSPVKHDQQSSQSIGGEVSNGQTIGWGGFAIFGSWLVAVIPKLKQFTQLTGFVVLLGAIVASQTVERENVPGAIATGIIGVLIIIFGQVLNVPNLQNPFFVLCMFLFFCIFGSTIFWLSLHYAPQIIDLEPGPGPPPLTILDKPVIPANLRNKFTDKYSDKPISVKIANNTDSKLRAWFYLHTDDPNHDWGSVELNDETNIDNFVPGWTYFKIQNLQESESHFEKLNSQPPYDIGWIKLDPKNDPVTITLGGQFKQNYYGTFKGNFEGLNTE